MGETIIKILVTVALAGVVIGLLPTSPFAEISNNISSLPYLAELNWFIPIGNIVRITTAWASAVLIYFSVSWILRQLDIIGA